MDEIRRSRGPTKPSLQFGQQALGFVEIRCVEAFGEPVSANIVA
jgi:hypothetical protein